MATLPMRVAPGAIQQFIALCTESSNAPTKAISDLAKAFPGMTLHELIMLIEGRAYPAEVDGGFIVVVEPDPPRSPPKPRAPKRMRRAIG